MPELRKDLIREHWVALATDRALKPSDFPTAHENAKSVDDKKRFCPFCEGNESCTPPEKDAYRPNGSMKNTSGWNIRVIPNKFSAFDQNLELNPTSNDIYTCMNSAGVHEVIIETADHNRGWVDYNEEEIYQLLLMYQKRFAAVQSEDCRIKYIQLYKNYGLYSGASLEHNHSQLIGFPVIPNSFEGFKSHYENTGRCLLCDIIKKDIESSNRVIYEGNYFLLVCPYASRYSYEAWILPKVHRTHFMNLPEEELREMSQILHSYIPHMFKVLNKAAYNLLINSGPVNMNESDFYFKHWYMEIVPRLIIPAGVETKTDIFINPVAPELAAQILKEGLKVAKDD